MSDLIIIMERKGCENIGEVENKELFVCEQGNHPWILSQKGIENNYMIFAGKSRKSNENIYFYTCGVDKHPSGFQYRGYFADINREGQIPYMIIAKNFDDLKKILESRSSRKMDYLA